MTLHCPIPSGTVVGVCCDFWCVLCVALFASPGCACVFVHLGCGEAPQHRAWYLLGTQYGLVFLLFPDGTIQTRGACSLHHHIVSNGGKNHSHAHQLPWDIQGKLD